MVSMFELARELVLALGEPDQVEAEQPDVLWHDVARVDHRAAQEVGHKFEPFKDPVDLRSSVGMRCAKVNHAAHRGDAVQRSGQIPPAKRL